MVSGFRNGADDYVVKPFELEVLYSRICALLRRAGYASGQYLTCDGITLDRSSMRVFCGHEEVALSQPEYQVLLVLLQNKGRTVSREMLLEQVWDSNGNYVNDNTLTAYDWTEEHGNITGIHAVSLPDCVLRDSRGDGRDE